MLYLITGNQGDGKSLLAVKKAFEAYCKGKKVYSNIKLNFPCFPININDIIECRLSNGVVIWDEIHRYISNRKSVSKNSIAICDGFLSMVRKQGLEVYGITQRPRKVDLRYRDELNYLFECTKYAYLKGTWQRYLHNADLPIEVPIMIKIIVTEIDTGLQIEDNFIGNNWFNMYDSKEIIKVVE